MRTLYKYVGSQFREHEVPEEYFDVMLHDLFWQTGYVIREMRIGLANVCVYSSDIKEFGWLDVNIYLNNIGIGGTVFIVRIKDGKPVQMSKLLAYFIKKKAVLP